MAAVNPDIVHVESCGVSVDINKGVFNDVRYMTAMAAVSDESRTETERLVWYVRALDLLFGGDAYKVQNQLANANGGKLDEETFNTFYREIMEQVAAKN